MKKLLAVTLLLSGCGSQPTPPLVQHTPTSKPRSTPVRARVSRWHQQTVKATPKPVQATPRPVLATPKPVQLPPKVAVTALRLPGPEKLDQKTLAQPADPSSAAEWRKAAEARVKQGAFSAASQAYAREAAIYRQKGDREAAIVEDLKASRYRTQIELYCWRPADDPVRPPARLEPSQGCLVGAFIDRDTELTPRHFGPQRHGDIPEFNALTGKRHASFFTYLGFQRKFPSEWADYVREQGAVPQLAWEPQRLEDVTDQALEQFVDRVADYGGPVFVRFAGEMNGDWTRYHGNPALYRQTFRRVYKALRRTPQAALIWCPNALPPDNIADYYPGDDGCDWVGVNFYSVLFLDNDPNRPGDWIHPIDLLDPVYRRYAGRKPIAIGEYAASHQAKGSGGRVDFARIKLAQLYQSLPLQFPQLKLVSWYDCNNLTQARSERQLNNFQLTDDPKIRGDYRRWVGGPWFLGAGQSSASLQARPFPKRIPGSLEIEPWVRSYVPNPAVYVRLDGKLVALHRLPEGGRYRLPTLKAGAHKLELLVYDTQNRFVDKRTWAFRVDD